jgi:hypothetical protein
MTTVDAVVFTTRPTAAPMGTPFFLSAAPNTEWIRAYHTGVIRCSDGLVDTSRLIRSYLAGVQAETRGAPVTSRARGASVPRTS